MRSTAALAILGLLSSVATAQPGGAPPPPPPPVYSPPPPQPPGYGYPQQPVGLSPDDQRILARGEINAGEVFGGAVLNFFIGFGSGQAVQGRWSEKGWIFTVGELASWGAMFLSVNMAAGDCTDGYCDDDGFDLFVVGMIGVLTFRVWGFVDSLAGPSSHNRKLREIQMRMGYPQPRYYSVAPFVAPSRDGGGTAGITVRF